MSALALDNVEKHLGSFVLGPVTLRADSPLTAIVGPSGAGKTTLLSLLTGLIPPHRGVIRHGDRDIAQMSDSERAHFRRDHIGIALQQPFFIGTRSVIDNLSITAKIKGAADPGRGLLERLALRPDALALELSGGELSRANIARAFIGNPETVVLDEPTAMLDSDSAQLVIGLILEESARRKVVVATHDERVVRSSSVVWTIDNGRIL